jgi:ankyrin repeat protein
MIDQRRQVLFDLVTEFSPKDVSHLQEILADQDLDVTSMFDHNGKSLLHVAAENDASDSAELLVNFVRIKQVQTT